MKTHASIPLGDFAGHNFPNPFRGASDAAAKCQPQGYGWLPKFPHWQTRAEKVALYQHKRALGRITDEAWKAICADYPEVKQ